MSSTESLEKILFFFCCHLKKFWIFPKYLKNTQAHAYARVYECRSPKSYACVAIAMKVTELCSCFCAKTLPCLCHFANEAHTLSTHNLPLTTCLKHIFPLQHPLPTSLFISLALFPFLFNTRCDFGFIYEYRTHTFTCCQ